ncbi:unnamed protein product [Danaus chrysippus]|uniref:(African queen) hypothetical protein n=1 Tax=Danaus chrysippus TaxID=151541 RepID=A0A8J2MEX9_9NEOP|nr:unnamed protein product [Danaus chrysippus]
MLDRKIVGRFCGIAITVGDLPSDDRPGTETRKLHNTGNLDVHKHKSVYGYVDFCNSFPVLQYATRLPDFRCRMYRNNMIYGIQNGLVKSLNEIQIKLKTFDYCYLSDLEDELHKAIDETAGSILKFIDIVQSTVVSVPCHNVIQYNTELDLKQMELQMEELNSEGWPDIVVWLLNNGSRVAFAKISAADIVHSVISEQKGEYCGRIQTLCLKPLKCPKHMNSPLLSCHCVAGKVELLMWMGLHRQSSDFEFSLPRGYKLRMKKYNMFVKSNIMGKTELLGRIKIYPEVTDEPSYENAPSLQWYDFYRGTEFAGQILMSVQLLQIPERLLRSTEYTSEDEIFEANTVNDAEVFEGIESLPMNLLPKPSTYKVDVYWWGLRDIDSMRKPCVVMEVEDLSIKSEIITDKSNNCNFSKGRTTQIYETEVETQPQFSKFKDWCATLKLYNGKKTGIPDKDEKLYCGFLKAGFAIYKWPPPTNTIAVTPSGIDLNRGFFDDHPHNNPAEFLVRVYIVKGVNLKSKEFIGKSNPYIALNCGNKHIADRNNYVPNSVNPIFGKMHEVHCCLPDDYLLAVSLYDYGINSPDKLIGTTTIDLEDRIYSKHRARVGLPSDYSLNEPFKWRDCLKPSEILDEICSKNHLPPPRFINSNTLLVNGVEYRNNEKGKVMLNLNALTCGEKQAQDCSLESLNNNKKIDLFYSESIKSWWPLVAVDESSGAFIFKGCIHLELTLMPLEKAVVMPVGIGRKPPFPLAEPA